MLTIDPTLEPDWDDDNISHIALHGLHPEQVEELYYNEGPHPTIAMKNKKRYSRLTEYRLRLWGTDACGNCLEAVIAPYPEHGLWRCVTAFPMSLTTRKAYFRRIKEWVSSRKR